MPHVQSLSNIRLCNPVECCLSGSLSMELSRHKYWSELSFPSPGGLPDPGIEPTSPALAGGLIVQMLSL